MGIKSYAHISFILRRNFLLHFLLSLPQPKETHRILTLKNLIMNRLCKHIVIAAILALTGNVLMAQVGIGTSTPERQLEIYGDWQTARIKTFESGPYLEFIGTASTDWAIGSWENAFDIASSTDNFNTQTSHYQFTTSAFRPSANNTKALGWDFGRWSNVYTVQANLSGLLNGNDAIFQGSLGVGTPAPARILEVYGNNWRTARISSSANGASLEFVSAGNPDWAAGEWNDSFRLMSSGDNFNTSTDEYWFTQSEFRPFGNNNRNLGTTSVQWSKLYSVDGFFTGKVGVGTQNPVGKLHVHDANSQHCIVYLTPTAAASDSASIFLAENSDASQGMYWLYDGMNDEMELWGKSGAIHYGPHMKLKRGTGEIAFGNTYATGYKLAVTGKVICEEVRVEETTGWPDYVFADDYNLMSLQEVEQSIKENKHLPGIPSVCDIQSNGFELGDMSKKLLEKVEELTLYAIEQNKKIDGLEKKLAELENQNRKVKKTGR
jgi:hypothetical protein